MKVDPARVIVAMITPFSEDTEKVNYSAAARLSEDLVAAGADGILVSGTTGESPALSKEEKLNLLDTVIDAVGKDAQIWMGSGTNHTSPAVELTREAEEHGADGIMLVTPYYNKPPQSGLYEHFRVIAANCSLPVMLYNVPSRTGVNLQPETVARLSEIDNIVAVKEASGDIHQSAKINYMTGEDFLIYSGDDQLTLPILSVGGWGVVSVAAHLVAGQIRQMIDSYVSGDVKKAEEMHLTLLPLFDALTLTTNPIPVKEALKIGRADVGGFRLPLVGSDDDALEKLKRVMDDLKIIQ